MLFANFGTVMSTDKVLAAEKLLLPGSSKFKVQVPGVRKVTTPLATVQTLVVALTKVTESDEVEVAAGVYVDCNAGELGALLPNEITA